MKNVLLTGGCGFIGTNFVHHLFGPAAFKGHLVNVDTLSYAGTADNLKAVEAAHGERYRFVRQDICDSPAMERLLREHAIDTVIHMAAESHVDRSIDSSEPFIQTNVKGTHALLEAARRHVGELPDAAGFRFLHVSTDEVFGALGPEGTFTEESPYQPNSPYAASKASSDLLVRAWGRTYGLPVLITNCSNNYGPWQFPEKLIPVVILNALQRRPVPVYGKGANVRDWLYVEDHASALVAVAEKAEPGARYNIGGDCEQANIDLVTRLLEILTERLDDGFDYRGLITFVTDRPGHDHRYSVDSAKLQRELGWKPTMDLDTGLRRTVDWYLGNRAWWEGILGKRHELKRLGRLPASGTPAR